MSWTDIFPVLSEEMLDAYRTGVSAAEKAEFEEWFGIKTQDARLEDIREDEETAQGKAENGEGRVGRSKGLKIQRSEEEGGSGRAALPLSGLTSCVLQSCVSPSSVSASRPARRHIVSATLFWKNVNGVDPDLPVPTRVLLVDARRMGLVKRFDPWGSYIEPLFVHTPGGTRT